jgi:hypothetical protein
MSTARFIYLVLTCALFSLVPTSAQTRTAAAALASVEGAVYVDDQLVARPDTATFGDSATIRTARGRAVVSLKHGGMLALNDNTLVRLHANGVYNFNRIEVLEGTAVVISDTSAPLVACRSDARLSSGGVFRFDVQPAARNAGAATCRFRVYDGAAAVPLVSLISVLRSGQTMSLDPTCGDMIQTTPFAPEQLDDFDRWSREQATVRRR